MEAIIRLAADGDFDAVCEIANEAFYEMVEELPHLYRKVQHSISSEEFDGKLTDPNAFVLVAVLNKATDEPVIAGFLIGEIKQASDHEACTPREYGYVSYFGVKEGLQKQGIGSLLFDSCIEEVSQRGGSFLELKVWEFNRNAIRFYEKYGMKTLNRTMELSLQ